MDFPENKTGLLADTPEGDNAPPLTVSELSGALKRSVESAFGRVRVRGEISGFKRHASGHLYFTLKDDRANLDAVIWRGGAGALAFAPEARRGVRGLEGRAVAHDLPVPCLLRRLRRTRTTRAS